MGGTVKGRNSAPPLFGMKPYAKTRTFGNRRISQNDLYTLIFAKKNLVMMYFLLKMGIFHSHSIPWDWYIYLHEWLIFMVLMQVNVGFHVPYMDPMGNGILLY